MNGRDDEWIIAVLILLGVWLFEIIVICSIGIGKPLSM